MHPVLLALVSAASGAFLFSRVAKAAEERTAAERARQAALGMSAQELVQGRTYAVQIMVDPRMPGWGGAAAPKDLATASALIKATYEQLGWRLLNLPAIADVQNAQRFFAGQPALWVFSGVWSRPEKFQAISPDWATMTLAQELPTLPAAA